MSSEAQHSAKACPDQCLVLEDLDTGWEGGCFGLQNYPSETQEQCRSNCCADAACEVWQFSYTGCWRGKGHYCRDGQGLNTHRPENLRLVAAQRISHGTVKVVETSLDGKRCLGLKEEKYTSKMFEKDLISRCRRKCYSDTTCGIWQVANGTCWYGPSLLCRLTFKHGEWIAASERIRHECKDVAEDIGPFTNLVASVDFVLAMLLGLVVLVWIIWGCCCRRITRRRMKNSIDLQRDETMDEPFDSMIEANAENESFRDSFSETVGFMSCNRRDYDLDLEEADE